MKKVKTIITIMLISIITISCNSENKNNSNKKEDVETTKSTIELAEQIKPTDICMFYNVILDAPSEYPVKVDGKTYYGCCDYSSSQLREDSTTRFSIDPFSGEKVDKVGAIIFPDPTIDNGVLYFKTKDNYLQFIKKLNK
jgi:hypothetical protein